MLCVADFKKLRVWHAAQDLAIDAHRVTALMKGKGSMPLRDQLLRAAMSVPTNIIEGSAHDSPREFARFIGYSLASASEVEGHARLAWSVGMINEADAESLIRNVEAVRMMLHGLRKRLRENAAHG
jgi:four helix bundle protein